MGGCDKRDSISLYFFTYVIRKIRFVDVKPDEGTNAFMAKEVAFLNGIYNDIHKLIDAINVKLPNRIFILNSKKHLAAKS